jgi:hypothetical protein
MTQIFTTEEITTLSAQIDNQLRELKTESESGTLKGEKNPDALPAKQSQVIAQITKEDLKAFCEDSDVQLKVIYAKKVEF